VRHFVLDASIPLAWFIDPSVAPLAVRVQQFLLQGNRALVPPLWRPEVANGFVVAQKRGTLSANRISQAHSELELLMSQSIEGFDCDFPVRRIVAVAQRFALTAYDAIYLEMARELNLPLATLDRGLISAAGQASVLLIS
jgi:predicted nucleic acid-binding protein